MEYEDNHKTEILLPAIKELIGQAPFAQPSVFNFYSVDYQPVRFPDGVSAPEFEIFTAPFSVSFLNGMMALIENGLSSCDEGFGPSVANAELCKQGNLMFPKASTTDETLST